MAQWGEDLEPTFVHARPRPRIRPRHPSESFVPRIDPTTGQTLYIDQSGLQVPLYDQFGRRVRSSSISGRGPATIVINNENAGNKLDEDYRPNSGFGDYPNYEGAVVMARRPSNRSHRNSYAGRSPSPYDDYYIDHAGRKAYYRDGSPRRSREDEEKMRSLEEKEKELQRLKQKEKEKEQERKLKEEILIKELEREKKRKEREEEDKRLREKAIEEYKEKEKKEKEKRQKEKEEQENEFVELLRTEGYTEAEARKKLRRMEKRKEKGVTAEDDGDGRNENSLIKSRKPTYIKVHLKHISPETLDVFQLPWEYDQRDPGFVIIKQWLGEREQEILFNHTKQIAERKRLTYSKDDLKNDHQRLVIASRGASKERKKSPVKTTSWFFPYGR